MIIINEQNLPPEKWQSQESPVYLSFLKDVKVFDLASSTFINFEELIRTSGKALNIEFEVFFPNQSGTQWGYMKIRGSKIMKTLPLLEINVVTVVIVKNDERIIGYITTYCRNIMHDMIEEYISIEDFSNDKLLPHFLVPPHPSKDKDRFCNRLLKTLILSKAEGKNTTIINVGKKQGLNVRSTGNVIWETKDNYPSILHNVIPESIACRKRPLCREGFFKNVLSRERALQDIFERFPDLKTHFLVRTSSYFLKFAAKHGVYFSQIVNVTPTERADVSFLSVLYDNVHYGHGEMLVLSNAKGISHASGTLNDAILCVTDDTSIDEYKKRDDGINVLHETVINCKNDFCQIPVLISGYAAAGLRQDLSFEMIELNGAYAVNPAILCDLLEYHDAKIISSITKKYETFADTFDKNIESILYQAPYFIPVQRLSSYNIFITVMRTYNEEFGEFFDDETEQSVIDMLSSYKENEVNINDIQITAFSKKLNEVLSIRSFHYVKRKKFIVFDVGTDTVIIDDNFAYFETATIKNLAEKELGFHSVNTLTDALKADGSLNVNMHNCKCYKFTVQNSQGESYNLYTYGISKLLINAANRMRLELADYEKFLLEYIDFEEKQILPLGITADGHYVGKDVSYKNKSNDSMFITGQSGKGKSFCATNLLPSLAMLGSRMLVCDVSKSFTHDEILRALPVEVVNALFEFIDIGGGQRKLPVNPLYIGDCTNLPAKKRRIMGFIKAVCKLDKDEIKIVEGVISEMLKKNCNIVSVTSDMLGNTLKKSGNVGNKVYSLISSTLDDIELIGFEYQGWGEFFEKSKRIPVILFGDEVDSNVHTVLDVLVSSAFTWQRDHNTAPLSIVIDEIKMPNFSEFSPLYTILTQGRKFNTRLIGMTQHYISNGSHAIDVMKEAGIKIFFKPAKSLERIATELGYMNPADAGFANMGIGDFILSCDAFNKVDGVNEPVVIHAKAIKFIDTSLFEKFKKEYDIK